MVITPWEEIGQYGGTWHRLSTSPGDVRTPDRLCYEFLIRWDNMATELYPNLASKWTVNGDNTEFTFTLRPGLKWSDGEPYTTDDVGYYYEDVMTNEDLTPTISSDLKRDNEPVEYTGIDDMNFKLTFASAYPLFPIIIAGSPLREYHQYPKHYCQQFHPNYTDQAKLDKMAQDAGFEYWYQLYGDKCRGGSAWRNNVDFPVINAWKITVPPPKQPVVMERNPYYWKVDSEGNQLPYIDRIEHMIVSGGGPMINQRAIAGEVDMQMRHMTFDNYPLFMENREKGDYRVIQWTKGYATDAVLYINYYHKDPVLNQLFNDKRFRYALSLGINRQEVIDAVYLGVTEPLQVSPPEGSPFYWHEWAHHMTEHDVDQANAYIDEIGLVNERDSEGYRLRPDGKRLQIEFMYAPVFGAWGSYGELLRAHWKDLGIDLMVKENARNLRTERVETMDYDLNVWTADASTNPLIGIAWYCARGGGHEVGAARWWNTNGKEGIEPEGKVRELNELFFDFRSTSDQAERLELFREILEINKDQMFLIAPCTAPPEVVCVKNDFRNVPEEALSDWQYMTPGNTMTEQYFIRQS
jgi:peptide/nickel transport system substrate-binding protein